MSFEPSVRRIFAASMAGVVALLWLATNYRNRSGREAAARDYREYLDEGRKLRADAAAGEARRIAALPAVVRALERFDHERDFAWGAAEEESLRQLAASSSAADSDDALWKAIGDGHPEAGAVLWERSNDPKIVHALEGQLSGDRRHAAAFALGFTGAVAALPSLKKAVGEQEVDPEFQVAAARAWLRINPDAGALRVLRKLAVDPDAPAAAAAATKALAESGETP